MDDLLFNLFIALFFGILTGLFAMRVAENKGRSSGEGFLLGFLLSIVGVIIEAVLPKADARTVSGLHLDKKNKELRKCPFCAEMVLSEAVVCRYCSRNLPERDKGPIFTSSAI